MKRRPDSFSASSERQAEDRYLTVHRVAKVVRQDDKGLWRVRNMSNRGMLFEVDVPVSPNERLTIIQSDAIRLTGRVMWSGDGLCGIVFDEPVHIGELLRALVAEREAEGYRPLRLSLRSPARLWSDEGETEIMVTSLSRDGVGFSYDGELAEGDRINIALADGLCRRGNIKWFNGQRGGIRLACPFAISQLESLRNFISVPRDSRSFIRQ